MRFDKEKIKIIATDFDGIITDGFLYLSTDMQGEIKKISFKDIMGMSLALKNGYKIAIISGEKNNIIDRVADKFKLEDVHQGIKDKLSVILALCEKYSVSTDQICYLGDDINDITALENVGFPVTVPGANFKVKKIPDIYITKAHAGDGAFREIIDLLLD